jgi:invasion protein IalB
MIVDPDARRVARWSLAALILGLGSSVALSTEPTLPPRPAVTAPAAKPAAVSSEPAMTTATYGDWLLRCQRPAEGDSAAKVCEVVQTIQVQGQQAPIAVFAIGRQPNKTMHATVVLPANIALPSLVRVGSADGKDKVLELNWTRCLPGGCYADAVLPDDLLPAWRAASQARTLKFASAAGRDVELPLSLRGLPQALDALAKQ